MLCKSLPPSPLAFGSRLTPTAAQQLQEDVGHRGACMMWVVAERPGHFIAFSVTEDGIGSGWLAAGSLPELRQDLPSRLVRCHMQPSEVPGVVEIWLPA
jgi:hypothetical protein